jgi:hypothetical protein
MPAAKWEDKFDREKVKYWESVLKWQAKAAGEPKTSTTPSPKPALVPQKQSRRAEISVENLSDDDAAPLHCRMHHLPEPDSDDESMATQDVTYVDSGDEDVIVDPPTLALPFRTRCPRLPRIPRPSPTCPLKSHLSSPPLLSTLHHRKVLLPVLHNSKVSATIFGRP